MKKLLFLLFPVAAMALTAVFAMGRAPQSACAVGKGTVTITTVQFAVDLAVTPAEWEHGLSGRPQLGAREGMLFLFPYPAMRAFWMKDMNFPIDIVWIDAEWHIVGIERQATPATYPSTFTSPSPVVRVLEIAGGEGGHINVGDSVEFTCQK